MAHLVQAGNARPKVRSPWGVFGLGLITGGLYSAWWWHRTATDLHEFETSDGGESPIKPGAEGGIMAALVVVSWIAQIAFRETERVTTASGIVVERSTTSPLGGLIALATYVGMLVMAGRMLGNVRRVMTKSGMLPEEHPGGVKFWLVSVVFGVLGSSYQLQSGMNNLWERYPRWYKSIGGTKEEFGAGPQQVPVGGTAPIAAAMHVHQAVPAGVPAPAGTPLTAVPAAAGGADPATVLHELGARAQAGQLDAASAYRYAQAVEQVHGVEAASQWYRFVANTDPSNLRAIFWTGSYLLGRGDEDGMAYLHRAAQDPQLRAPAAQALAAHLERVGRTDEAARWRSYAAA